MEALGFFACRNTDTPDVTTWFLLNDRGINHLRIPIKAHEPVSLRDAARIIAFQAFEHGKASRSAEISALLLPPPSPVSSSR